MAKNKGTHGKGRSSVEQEDEFIEGAGKVAKALEPHAKKLVAAAALLFAGAVAWSLLQSQKQSSHEAATELYGDAMRLSMLPVSSDPVIEPPVGASPNRPFGFKTEKERSEAVLAVLDTLKKQHGDTEIYASARALEGQVLLSLGRYDEAKSVFRAAPPSAATKEGLAYATEAVALAAEDASQRQKGLEEALALYEGLDPSGDAATEAGAMALYHQGRLLGALGRTDEAKAKLTTVLEKQADSPLSYLAEVRLALLAGGGAAPAAPGGTDADKEEPAKAAEQP